MKPPQNDCFKLFRLQKELYQNNMYSWKAFMFQKSILPQPHLQNQMEKCFPATLSSSFYTKMSPAYPGYCQKAQFSFSSQ